MVMLIKLTPRQRGIAEWAIDPMEDYFKEQFESGEMIYMPEMPSIRKDTDIFELPEDKEIVGDLLYRLENLFQDICNDALTGLVADYIVVGGKSTPNVVAKNAQVKRIRKARGDATSARQLARKIRAASSRRAIRPVEYV